MFSRGKYQKLEVNLKIHSLNRFTFLFNKIGIDQQLGRLANVVLR